MTGHTHHMFQVAKKKYFSARESPYTPCGTAGDIVCGGCGQVFDT